MATEPSRRLDSLTLLAEPLRRTLYEYVVSRPHPVDRDAAAAATGIGRPLVAFHLDRLVRGGLLATEYHRRSGRSGPGAGRPAKFYRRAPDHEVEVTLPPRRYGLAAEILADGIDRSAAPEAAQRVLESARAAGERLVEATKAAGPPASGPGAVVAALAANGYEPVEDAAGVIRLRNCPFHALVEGHRELTCSMNLAMLGPVADRLGDGELEATSRPEDGYCCVAFVPAEAP
jgi:predicted ArsR family transcriptional regulator